MIQLKRRTITWVLAVAAIFAFGNELIAQTSGNTEFAEYYTISGKFDYTVIGNSEITEVASSGTVCGTDASTSRTLTLPAGATVVKAYVHWYGMVRNTYNDAVRSSNAYRALGNITFQGPSGAAQSLNATARPAWSQIGSIGSLWYESKKADVTSIMQGFANPSGTYTIDVTGAHPTVCGTSLANVRAWTLTVVYTNASSPAQKIYLYDGFKSIYQTTNVTTVSGYKVPTGNAAARAGNLTSVFLQGDSGIVGESCVTSDSGFPNYPTGFANGSSGGTLDIDVLSGSFTANSTSLNITTSTTGDLIVLGEHVIKIPSICFAGDTAPALSATTKTNNCPSLTTSLTTITASNLPANTSLTFHSETPANDANKLTTAQAGTISASGVYYAAIFDTNGLCYSPTTQITVTINPCVVATADTSLATATQGINGVTLTGSVLSNDTFNGIAATTSNVNISVNTLATAINGGPVPSLDTANGRILIPTGTPAGQYTINYRICPAGNTSNCANANITITIPTPAIDAVNDTLNTTSNGGTTTSVFGNDTYNGAIATSDNVTLSTTGVVPTGLTLNTTTGVITVAAGTPPATYTLNYQICDKINTSNCDPAAATVVVAPSINILADTFTSTTTQGINVANNVVNVLTNDKVNGLSATSANSTITINTAATAINGGPIPTLSTTNGNVSIPAGTPAGTYTISYKLCALNSTVNCDSNTVTITVPTPAIDAVVDNFTFSGEGNTTMSILANDSYDGGAPGSATNTLVAITKVGTWPAAFTLNADGSITIASGTASGIYPLEYRICDNINPSNCDNAIAAITITACYLPGSIDLGAGNTLDTSVGISSLDRAGAVSAWPQARKSGWIALEAKTKGFVVNRVKFANDVPVAQDGVTLVITSPIEGMMVYDTTNNCLKVYTTTNGINFAWFCMTTQTCPQ